MTHAIKIKRGFSYQGLQLERDEDLASGEMVAIDEEIADSETDKLVALTLDVSQVKAIYLESDQDITLETNDGAVPDDTISMAADVPQLWSESDGAALRPLTVDVTGLYVTNASGSAATLKAWFLVDPTL